jgi:hypothetical protein
MAIGVNNLILAQDYNGIQTEVNNTLFSVGSGDRGYGQTVTSAQVTAGSLVTAQHLINLKIDLDKISFHQTNTASSAPAVNVGGTIKASDWAAYSTAINNLTQSRLTISDSTAQGTWLLDQVAPTMTQWGGTRIHSLTVDFANFNQGRYFFNSGGEIRIVPRQTSYSSSTTKGGRWNNLFSNLGTSGVRFRANSTLSSGGTSATTIGFYQLTVTDQIIHTSTDTGTYFGNQFKVEAKKDSTGRYVYFKITFDDSGVFGNIDEPVEGTTTSSVGTFRATGSYVAVPSPTFTTNSGP